jgi:hypothetical protein
MTTTRRTFVAGSAVAGAFGLTFPGEVAALTPARTRLRALPYRVLKVTQAATLDAFGDVLLPGAQLAGLSHYIDQQLGLPPWQQVLMIKYLGPSAPFADFYSHGLAALDEFANVRYGRSYSELSGKPAADIVAAVAHGAPAPWKGPPAALFHFVVRNDALDVVYGTEAGFARLSIPYMAHISPPKSWPE